MNLSRKILSWSSEPMESLHFEDSLPPTSRNGSKNIRLVSSGKRTFSEAGLARTGTLSPFSGAITISRVYVIVEGPTEESFVGGPLYEVLWPHQVFVIPIILGVPGHKGGRTKYVR